MEHTQQRRALEIFSEVVELSETEQQTRIQSLAQGDTEVIARVLALLGEDADPKILQTQVSNVVFESPPPETIGPYKIVDRIGAGGMGVVYEGQRADDLFEQRVAIKFLHAGLYSEELLRRFTVERQVTAQLEHPGIARLLDGGEVEGRPYFIMEYIEGEELGFSSHRSMEATLRLFLQVCEAISYAHNNFVLHRDIKPSNILVTESGLVKVLDFGVAKIVDPSDEQDHTQAVPMTKPYTSPEGLIGSPATVRSDVYSLGVLLYELFHNKQPFDLSDLNLLDAHAYVSANKAPVASGHADLDLIINQALHADVARRYASAELLADDVRRFLSNQPISARSDDVAYRAKKFVLRNKGLTAGVALAFLALAVGLSVSTVLFFQSEEQARIAALERDRAEEVVEFLATTLADTNPLESGKQELTLGEILQAAEDKISAGALTDEIARAYVESSLSLVYDGRGEYTHAADLARQAVQRMDAQGVIGKPLALALTRLGQALINNDQYEASLAAFARADEELADFPDEAAQRIALLTIWGSAYERLTRYADAESVYRESLVLATTYNITDPRLLAQPNNNLGQLLHSQGDFSEAETFYTRAVELLAQTPAEQAMVMGNLAGVLDDRGDYARAESRYREALDLIAEALGPDHPQSIIVRASLTNSLVRAEKFDAAREQADAGLASTEASLPEVHFISAYALNVAGNAYCHGPQDARGLAYAQRSLDIRRELLPDNHWLIGSSQSLVGLCQIRMGDFAGAVGSLESAYAQLLERRGADDRNTVLASTRLEQARAGLGD